METENNKTLIKERISMQEIWMNTAKLLASRSTCSKRQVGTVITSPDLYYVYGVGYNGGAKGLPDVCAPDSCHCIHSEINALIKCTNAAPKTAFITLSPCYNCATGLINANVTTVYFAELWKDTAGLNLLYNAGVQVFRLVDGRIEQMRGLL